MVSKYEDIHELKELIKDFAALQAQGKLTKARIDSAQELVDELAQKYGSDPSVGTDYFLLCELQGLIHEANGNWSEAEAFIQDAVRIKGDTDLISTRARNIIANRENSNATSSPPVEDTPRNGKRIKNTDKIAGWLVIVALGVILVPFINLFGLFEYFDLLHEIDGLGLTTLKLFLYFEMFLAAVSAIAFVIYWFYFFPKKKVARIYGIYLYGAVFTVGIADIIAALIIFNNLGLLEETAELFGSAIRDTIVTGIWWAYFIKSARVKQTFVK